MELTRPLRFGLALCVREAARHCHIPEGQRGAWRRASLECFWIVFRAVDLVPVSLAAFCPPRHAKNHIIQTFNKVLKHKEVFEHSSKGFCVVVKVCSGGNAWTHIRI